MVLITSGSISISPIGKTKKKISLIIIDETIVDRKISHSELILYQLGKKLLGKSISTQHSHSVIIDGHILVSDILVLLKVNVQLAMVCRDKLSCCVLGGVQPKIILLAHLLWL
jgi:hypothetical protein